MVTEPVYKAGDDGDTGSIPGRRRSPGGGHGNPLQYSCLENPWTEETGGPQSIGHKESDKTEAADHSPAQTGSSILSLNHCTKLLFS